SGAAIVAARYAPAYGVHARPVIVRPVRGATLVVCTVPGWRHTRPSNGIRIVCGPFTQVARCCAAAGEAHGGRGGAPRCRASPAHRETDLPARVARSRWSRRRPRIA